MILWPLVNVLQGIKCRRYLRMVSIFRGNASFIASVRVQQPPPYHQMLSARYFRNSNINASQFLQKIGLRGIVWKHWCRCPHLVSRYWERRLESRLIVVTSLPLNGPGFRHTSFSRNLFYNRSIIVRAVKCYRPSPVVVGDLGCEFESRRQRYNNLIGT
jgi:hypothetical protein